MEFNRLITTIDAHSSGEPLRIITGGFPHLQGNTLLERMEYVRHTCDPIRRLIMSEPRGHYGMVSCIITPPTSSDAHFGIIFMLADGFDTMSGHGIIAAVTAWIETGQLHIEHADLPIKIDSPAGRITAYVQLEGAEVGSVSFDNVPSFVYATDVPLSIHGLTFTVDIAFGGAFYAIVEVDSLGGLKLCEQEIPDLQKWGREIMVAIESVMKITHPTEPALSGIHGVMITETDLSKGKNSIYRNITIYASGQFDRSPCGASASAYSTLLVHRGKLGIGETTIHQGIVGTQITVKVLSEMLVGHYKAVIPRITGHAFVTGFHHFVLDPTDPLAEGFLLR